MVPSARSSDFKKNLDATSSESEVGNGHVKNGIYLKDIRKRQGASRKISSIG